MNKCICENENFSEYKKEYYKVSVTGENIKQQGNEVLFGTCLKCGVVRRTNAPFSTKREYTRFYKDEYYPVNKKYTAKTYNHDRELAKLRCDDYGIENMYKILDVGSGSGAFVDECRERGKEAYGCEVSEYHYSVNDKFIYKQLLEDINFPTDHFDMVTCHDVLEHSLDPIKFIKEIFRIIKQGGRCIIDFPRYWVEEGNHHWNTEHLWFFREEQLNKLLKDNGFTLGAEVKYPIKSKVVFYLTKPKQNRVKILMPPGIGDSYWSVIKLQSFLKREKLGLPDVYIACNREKEFSAHTRAFPFLEMFPFLNSTGVTFSTPPQESLWQEAYKNKGRTIFKDVCGCDYFVSYNGHLRYGETMEQNDPDLECNWFPPMFVSLEQERFRKESLVKYGKYIVFYFVFQGTYKYWTEQFSVDRVIMSIKNILEKTGYVPVFAGAIWDRENDTLLKRVIKSVPAAYIDLTGQTTVEQLFGLIKGSQGVIGYPSGLTIMSAALKQKTLIIWNDYYNKNFAWNSCPPSTKNKTYFITDTKNLTPQDLAAKTVKMIEEKEKELKYAQIELTNNCNAGCPMCTHKLSKRKIVNMDLSLLRKIVDELKDMKLSQFVGVCGIGEPMLHPQFNEAIRIISNKLEYGISTNGQFLDKYIDLLIETKVTEVVVSIDASTEVTHNKMRPNVDFKVVENNTILFLDRLRHERKFWDKIYLQCIVSSLNVDEVGDFIERWLPKIEGIEGVQIYIKQVCPSPLKEANKYYPPPKPKDLQRYRENSLVRIDDFAKPIKYKHDCTMLYNFALILSDGSYTTCCMDGENRFGIGNVKEMTLMECFNSEILDSFRECRSSGNIDKIPFCNICI